MTQQTQYARVTNIQEEEEEDDVEIVADEDQVHSEHVQSLLVAIQ